jgi:hypothetical protein
MFYMGYWTTWKLSFLTASLYGAVETSFLQVTHGHDPKVKRKPREMENEKDGSRYQMGEHSIRALLSQAIARTSGQSQWNRPWYHHLSYMSNHKSCSTWVVYAPIDPNWYSSSVRLTVNISLSILCELSGLIESKTVLTAPSNCLTGCLWSRIIATKDRTVSAVTQRRVGMTQNVLRCAHLCDPTLTIFCFSSATIYPFFPWGGL